MCRTPYTQDDIVTKKVLEDAASSKTSGTKNDKKPSETESMSGRKKLVHHANRLGRSPKVQALFEEVG